MYCKGAVDDKRTGDMTVHPGTEITASLIDDRLEDALATKARLEAVITSAMDAIITINQKNEIIFFNPAAEAMFGIGSDDALGKPIELFIPERFRAGHGDHIKRFRTTGETSRRMGALGAISGLRGNGEEFPVEASISKAVVGGEKLATVILRDITQRKANEEARVMLAREVDHRAKNALAVVQAIVSLTRAPTQEAFVGAVQGRIAALGRAHSLLAQNQWNGADLQQVITEETSPYQRPGQISCSGPPITLTPKAVQPVQLLIHELATNAVKYGALSVREGRVEIEWSKEENTEVNLRWRESGGPKVVPPSQTGFGTTLISSVTGKQLKGQVEIIWREEGICVNAILGPGMTRTSYAAAPSSQESAVSPPPPVTQGDNRTLLVVEDEILVAMQMAQSMENMGWKIIGPANTVEEAHQLLADHGHVDAAILDVNIDGTPVFPIAEALHEQGVPILFCTGYETIEESERFEGCAKLRKPVGIHQIIREMNAIIERPLN